MPGGRHNPTPGRGGSPGGLPYIRHSPRLPSSRLSGLKTFSDHLGVPLDHMGRIFLDIFLSHQNKPCTGGVTAFLSQICN